MVSARLLVQTVPIVLPVSTARTLLENAQQHRLPKNIAKISHQLVLLSSCSPSVDVMALRTAILVKHTVLKSVLHRQEDVEKPIPIPLANQLQTVVQANTAINQLDNAKPQAHAHTCLKYATLLFVLCVVVTLNHMEMHALLLNRDTACHLMVVALQMEQVDNEYNNLLIEMNDHVLPNL